MNKGAGSEEGEVARKRCGFSRNAYYCEEMTSKGNGHHLLPPSWHLEDR